MRRLNLRKESLTPLGEDVLGGVAGGTHATCNATDRCTHGASLDATCPTTPVLICLQTITQAINTGLSCNICVDGH